MMRRLCFVVMMGALAQSLPARADQTTAFTLLRDSVTDRTIRVHVASFDTDHGEAYNLENCNLVAVLLQQQPGVRTRFWCEKGPYREQWD